MALKDIMSSGTMESKKLQAGEAAGAWRKRTKDKRGPRHVIANSAACATAAAAVVGELAHQKP
jgi:hypothetical protein